MYVPMVGCEGSQPERITGMARLGGALAGLPGRLLHEARKHVLLTVCQWGLRGG